MRIRFDQQLELLNTQLIRMGALCEQAISSASTALLTGDETLRRSVKGTEEEIDRKEREIEDLCLRLLLQQQPVAGDLRTISSALKMISDMERIGDQAADIAEIARDFPSDRLPDDIPIREMALATIHMVTNSIDSFVEKNLALARSVVDEDDRIDALFAQVRQNLASHIGQGDSGTDCIDLLMTAKYFERIGDHAVNIAQWVEYSLTGRHQGDS